jgi:hypothetical protein
MTEVSEDLRRAEAEIDREYLNNPIFQKPREVAAWNVLAYCENEVVLRILASIKHESLPSANGASAVVDGMINTAKWPLRWINNSCNTSSRVPRVLDHGDMASASQLYELSDKYLGIESAFCYATFGIAKLDLTGSHIRRVDDYRTEVQYEAYDRMTKADSLANPVLGGFDLLSRIDKSVKIKDNKFSYDFNQSIAKRTMEVYSDLFTDKFVLPQNYMLNRYSVGDYVSVAKYLFALAMVHNNARIMAALKGCYCDGILNAMIVLNKYELARSISKLFTISLQTVQEILLDLTFGERGIRQPDIAIQPLFPIHRDLLLISPTIIANSALERNFAVLLNKLPNEKAAYSELSKQREQLTKLKVQQKLQGRNFDYWSGNILEWGVASEIDLAIISPTDRACLVLELKSFIEPAEPRELFEKSEEIAKGIKQIIDRRTLFENDPSVFYKSLGIDASFRVYFAVASENSIGASWVQNPSVAVIRLSHLIDVILSTDKLDSIFNWLEKKNHLPSEGEDYSLIPVSITVGKWSLDWYGIRAHGDIFPRIPNLSNVTK